MKGEIYLRRDITMEIVDYLHNITKQARYFLQSMNFIQNMHMVHRYDNGSLTLCSQA